MTNEDNTRCAFCGSDNIHFAIDRKTCRCIECLAHAHCFQMDVRLEEKEEGAMSTPWREYPKRMIGKIIDRIHLAILEGFERVDDIPINLERMYRSELAEWCNEMKRRYATVSVSKEELVQGARDAARARSKDDKGRIYFATYRVSPQISQQEDGTKAVSRVLARGESLSMETYLRRSEADRNECEIVGRFQYGQELFAQEDEEDVG